MRGLRAAFLLIPLLISCQQNPQEDWISLFNGTDLEGWMVKGEDATFEVLDGMVVGTNRGRTNTFLATENRYSDFILELEVWVDPRMNSGIQFRSNQKESGRVSGYQAENDPSPRAYSGGIYDEARRDWLYPLSLNPEGQQAFKNNEWNSYRIEAYGTSMRIWVNDICTAVLEDNLTTEGFIALQVHGVGTREEEGRQVKWRNARLLTTGVNEQLKPVPAHIHMLNLVPGLMTEHEKNQGWEWLINPSEMDKELKPIEGRKRVEGIPSEMYFDKGASSLLHDQRVSRFELSFQYKLDSVGECAIGYFTGEPDKKEYQIVVPQKYIRQDSLMRPGSLLGKLAPQNLSYAGMGERYLRGAGSWNTGTIYVSKDYAEHWMNGFKIIKYAIQDNRGQQIGRVTIDGLSGKANFRNLKIRSLK